MEKINWGVFIKKYTVSTVEQQIVMICSHLVHFDTQPDWVSRFVWGRALKAKGDGYAIDKNTNETSTEAVAAHAFAGSIILGRS